MAYVVCRLSDFDNDVRRHVWRLEEWMIQSLHMFNVTGVRRSGQIGVWVETPHGYEKIAAIGVRVHRGVAYHGVALNVCPDLTIYETFSPCGLSEKATSLKKLGKEAGMVEVQSVLKATFGRVFTPKP